MSGLSLAWRIAAREMRGGLRGFGVFLTCLALAVAALAAVGTVRAAIQAGLARDGAALLGGDAEVQLTYRFATGDERAVLDRIATAHGTHIPTVALAWLRARGVTAPIASASRPSQLPALLAASSLRLTNEELGALDDASQPFA